MFNLIYIKMKKVLLITISFLVFSCATPDEKIMIDDNTFVDKTTLLDPVDDNPANEIPAKCVDYEWITFDTPNFNTGDIVSIIPTSSEKNVYLYGYTPAFPNDNAAMIFDSSNPPVPGDDEDLGTPNIAYGGPGKGDSGITNTIALYNVLIISEDLNSEKPDDGVRRGSKLYFDFKEFNTVSISSIDIIDFDSALETSYIQCFNDNDSLILNMSIPYTGNNGFNRLKIDTDNVRRLVFRIDGSGAIDNLVFCD